ncbi:MAG: membrane protein insertion efficiency factor YidD [Acidobacteriia bacterium]|nr:membrane protein insertion efficiency factor YidD [Terriglobia bacterium]
MELLKKGVLRCLYLYKQFISPFLPPACRFWPSCSEYSHQAISKYGLLGGVLRGLKRLIKCHPFHPGGYDPLD